MVDVRQWAMRPLVAQAATVRWLAAGFAAVFVMAASIMVSAQGLHLSGGGGAALLAWDGETTVVQPAGLLAVGIDARGPLSLRLDLRALGNTDNAMLGGGLGAGVSGGTGPLPTAYLLGTGSLLLLTAGAWVSAYGVAAGAAGGFGMPLFLELRVESMSSDWLRGRGQHRHAVGSVVTGVRFGGRRSRDP
jgi:hypothetical protein